MNVKHLIQILLPVILTSLLSLAVLCHLQAVLLPEVKTKRYDYEGPIIPEDSDMKFSKADFDSSLSNITEEEVARYNSLVIDCTEDMSDNNWASLEDTSGGQVYELNLTKLKQSPKITSLTFIGDEADYSEEALYHLLDTKNLATVPQLQDIRLECVEVQNLSFLKGLNLTSLTFVNCNFDYLPEEQYSYLSGISSVAFQGENTCIDSEKLFAKMDGVKELDVSGIQVIEDGKIGSWKSLASLEGLSFAISSENLDPYKKILSQCQGLKKLAITYLNDEGYVADYELQEIENLRELEELTILGYSEGKYSYSYVDEFTVVTNYDSNRIEYDNGDPYHDYSYLGKLTKLKSLKMHDMELTDISFLKNDKDLTYVDLSYNFIHDVTPLQELTKLEELDLSFNGVTDTSSLSNLVNMRKLSLHNNNITSLDCVGKMKNLELLDIASGFYYENDPLYTYNQIYNQYYHNKTDETHFYNEPDRGFKPVNLVDQYIEDSYYTVYVTGLNYQEWTYENPFEMVYDTPNITLSPYQLESIWGTNRNKVESIVPVKELSKLKFLDISGNNVKDLSPLTGHNRLRFLGCMDNRIDNVDCMTFANLPNLQYLYMSQNPIEEGDNLKHMEYRLRKLDYYLTPYYNRTVLGMEEKKETPVSLDILGIDVATLFCNIITRGE